MSGAPFLVRIWGARGSLPGPAAENCKFGSESPCVEMRCGGHVLIFDAGSGIEGLSALLRQEDVHDFDIFFTHCHLDHIIGLPFLKALYDDESKARIYAGHLQDGTTCRKMIEGFMAPPYFPITPDCFCAKIDYRDFRPPQVLELADGISVGSVRLNHPNGSVGYRVNYDGRSVCYITDTEHVPGQPNADLIEAIRGADIMIYDCTYTDAEFGHYVGYGHSTWQEGVRLCEAAGVKRLVIFHHRLGRTDEDLERIEAEARARFPGAIVARTGLELVP